MYLTDKAQGKPHDISNHQTAELLLEYCEFENSLYCFRNEISSRLTYCALAFERNLDERRLDEVNESCQRLSTLLSEVDSNISLVLASTRVRLQNLELQVSYLFPLAVP